MAACPPSDRIVGILLLPIDGLVLNIQNQMLSGESLQIIALRLIEKNCKKYLEVSSPDTNVCQDIWIITSIHYNNGLNIRRNFLLTSDFIDEKDASLLISFMHHISQSGHDLNITSGAMAPTLRNDQPVSQVSTFPNKWVDFLEDHGKREEQSASQDLLREELD